ncbi:MAG: glycosyltransferase [Hydrogenophaga sp.]|uniref:glycosyltransferase n=1 Tax=Hydrogenophaga sp. TaxID=1904254 RepID=UPI0027617C4F|nr:glycosyltransferase [Hydrogenophaga sp.]MDP2416734.1 glycosyltransferase [Hydrogenophaga sp.]MDZ4189453.1 glycosyltransferase [Hydrogenophaga sp.]
MSKLLMITIELPYPPSSGGRMKSWNMLKFLSQHFDVGLACPVKYGTKEIQTMVSQIQLRHFLHDAVEIPRSGKTLAQSYLQGIPINVFRSRSVALKKQIASIAHEYDVILLDHYESGQYLPENFSGQVIFHAHNATYLMWERYAQSDANLLYRLVTWLEGKRVKSAEVQLCQRANLVFASPNDIDSLVDAGAERKKCRETYHLGDDSQLALPSILFKDTQKTLLYIGTLNWEANVDGLLWFFDKVWPLVVAKQPDTQMQVVGSKPDIRLTQAAAHDPRIQFTGFVEDLEPLFQVSRLFLAPLRFGSGIKVKVLNAMCRGLPTITTPVGAEGLAAQHMEHLSITETAEDMARSILHLMENESDWLRIETQSRALVREKYTWKKVLGYMVDQINTQLQKT